MATVLLVRHGRTSANTAGVLAGRAAGVRLDDVGRRQAERAAERIAAVPLVGVVSSPLERCRQTARALLERQTGSPPLTTDRALTECDYGEWQGRALADLAGEALWSVVQNQPSAAVFPGGESLGAMQARAVAAVRRHDAAVEAEHGPRAVWVAVSHGDVIKAVLADALGMHLDLFQRLSVGPASVSVVRYGPARPDVVATNTEAGDLSWLASAGPATDAPVGGGAGHEVADGADAVPADRTDAGASAGIRS
ncbi:MSMEG_4193 family putative phosphomutase [Cellulomonas carbonis]|uniref:Histidine phosphatase n=1 Tax=Cellulomonas carbonis T26 TaxID=947969 RepID=A0A0A0BXW4_9CELL|nr:MSMEG_4193 family putative phosphomutase [Cellulomonas carbonis]KGM12721.1 histidine phosphatase [Cellulomonas carbonis T26]GGC13801.1 phosphoglycerate mutase [Cellulomonas carbonis]